MSRHIAEQANNYRYISDSEMKSENGSQTETISDDLENLLEVENR